jgi:hypothetical protein
VLKSEIGSKRYPLHASMRDVCAGLGALNPTLNIILISLSTISICLCPCCFLPHVSLYFCNFFHDDFTLTIRDACSQSCAYHLNVDITSFSHDILGTDNHPTQPCNYISFTTSHSHHRYNSSISKTPHTSTTTVPNQVPSQQIQTHRNHRLDLYYKHRTTAHRVTAHRRQMRGDRRSAALAPQDSASYGASESLFCGVCT